MEERPSFGALLMRDHAIRSTLLSLAIIALGAAMLLVALMAVGQLDSLLGKIALSAPIVLIGGTLLVRFASMSLRTIVGRVVTLSRLAERGVIVRAELAEEGWTSDSDGDRHWTGTYRYSYMGTTGSIEQRTAWVGQKTVYPRSLELLIDPDNAGKAHVLSADRAGVSALLALSDRIGGLTFVVFIAGFLIAMFGGEETRWFAPLLVFVGLPVLFLLGHVLNRIGRARSGVARDAS